MNTLAHSSSEDLRQRIGKDLKLLLANTYVLYVKTQNFHWNVKGPRFQQLHLFFEEQYTSLATAIDALAEQVRVLGQRPPSSMKEFLEMATLQESEEELSEDEMLRSLASDYDAINHQILGAIHIAEETNDEATADLLTEKLRQFEKTAWMIRSHLG